MNDSIYQEKFKCKTFILERTAVSRASSDVALENLQTALDSAIDWINSSKIDVVSISHNISCHDRITPTLVQVTVIVLFKDQNN